MKKTFVAATLATIICAFAVLAHNSTSAAPNAKAFAGTWERFLSKDAEGKPAEERLVRSFLLFSADGHYSQTTLPAGREKLTKPVKEMTREELLNRFDGVSAFYGAYTIAGNKLTRKVITATSPNSDAAEFVQTFRFEGETLILSSTTAGSKGEARFRRVK
jgi:hypothetical protein